MTWWRRLFRRDRMERQLEAELRDHLDRQVADYVRDGIDEAEARRRAHLVLGGLEQVKEDCREARGTRGWDDLVRDVRQAGRVLWRSRRFTTTATLAIALGIGTNATFFSLVDAVLLRALPYHDPDRLVALSEWHPQRGRYGKVSGADFNEWATRTRVFHQLGGYWDRGYTLTGTALPESLVGWQFSANLFALLGARPLLGRTLLPDDGRPGHDDVAVISEALWRRRFAASPTVVGAPLTLDGRPYTIVGVMPREFAHPSGRTDVWTPLVLGADLLNNRDLHPLRVIGRLRDGVTLERARAELAGVAAQLAREHPASNADWRVDLRPIRDIYVGDIRPLLWLLQGGGVPAAVDRLLERGEPGPHAGGGARARDRAPAGPRRATGTPDAPVPRRRADAGARRWAGRAGAGGVGSPGGASVARRSTGPAPDSGHRRRLDRPVGSPRDRGGDAGHRRRPRPRARGAWASPCARLPEDWRPRPHRRPPYAAASPRLRRHPDRALGLPPGRRRPADPQLRAAAGALVRLPHGRGSSPGSSCCHPTDTRDCRRASRSSSSSSTGCARCPAWRRPGWSTPSR